MCGIVYAQSLRGRSVNKIVWDQYIAQKSRGQEGFGVFDGKFTVKAAMEKRIKRWFDHDKRGTSLLLFHHRFPTSTENVKRAAHPFNTGEFFGKTKYVLVHNGVIRNPKDLRKAHEEMGIKYQSVLHNGKFNDSEALLWDVALTMEGKQDKLKAYGGIAFVCIQVVDNVPVKMFFGRNLGRPLNWYRDKDKIMLSSEGPGNEIEASQLYTYNYELNRLTKKPFAVPSYDPAYANNWGNYHKPAQTPANRGADTTPRNLPAPAVRYERESEQYYNPRPIWDRDTDYIDTYGDADDDGEGRVYDDALGMWINNPRKSQRGAGSHTHSLQQLLNPKPKEADVNKELLRLLSAQGGNFYAAFFQGYAEIEAIDDGTLPLSEDDRREIATITEALQRIVDDPEYIHRGSIHPMWLADAIVKSNVKQPVLQGV